MSDPLSRLLASLVPTEQQQPAVPSQDQLNSLLASLQTPQAPSFAQTVTLLSQLVQDSTFVDAVQTLKRDQDEQELRFKDERNRLADQGRRAMLSPDALALSLGAFDRTVLTRWTTLQASQLARLEALGVPLPAATDSPSLARQQKTISLLVSLIEDL